MGRVVAERLEPHLYQTYYRGEGRKLDVPQIALFKPLGRREGLYRVGPLARLAGE